MAHWRSSRPADPGDLAAIVLCLLAALALWLAAGFFSAARSHSWYDGACCSGRDCFEVTRKSGHGEVTITRTGYNVVIWKLPEALGGMVLEPPLRKHVGQANTRRSQDEHPHACVFPVMGSVSGPNFGTVLSWDIRCLYVPDIGS